jgi:hypothetical protein
VRGCIEASMPRFEGLNHQVSRRSIGTVVTAIGQTSKHLVATGNNWLALALLADAFHGAAGHHHCQCRRNRCPRPLRVRDRGSVPLRLAEWPEHDPLRTASSVCC